MVTPYAMKLRKLFQNCDLSCFIALVGHLFAKDELRCIACGMLIGRSANDFIRHIKKDFHIGKMKERKLVYPLEPLTFWMLTLRMASAIDPWVSPVQRKKGVPESKIDPRSPLAVLSKFYKVPNPCKNPRLVISFMHRKLTPGCVDVGRLRKDQEVRGMIIDGKSVKCEVCPSHEQFYLDCPYQFIAHVISGSHVKALLADGGQVDMDAIFFWVDAMARASENSIEVSRSPLNRLLVAGMADQTSPIALLAHFTKVLLPCPDYARAMMMLQTKLRKCDIDKFNEAMHQYFGEALLCGVCVEYKQIRSGGDFIKHVTQDHITNATRSGGQVNKRALRFWLDALCAAGAVILPQEAWHMPRLFGEK